MAATTLVRVRLASLRSFRPKPSCRLVSSTTTSLLSGDGGVAVQEPEELRVPMPWGTIAVKRWSNNPDRPALVGIHGWLDNAATFDGLAPLLPLSDYNFYSMEMPGHGLSSRYPTGMTYKASDSLVVLLRLQQHFGFDTFNLLGHSMGAGIGFLFAATFPECVDKLVMLDLVSATPNKLDKQSRRFRRALTESVNIIDKISSRSQPVYTHQDAVARAFMGNQMVHGVDSISKQSVETLMTRGLRKVDGDHDDAYTWTTDYRLRIRPPFNLVYEQIEHFAEQITCPHLIVKSSDSPWYMKDKFAKAILKVYKKKNPNFEFQMVNGRHHVHLDDPMTVAPVVNEFLSRTFIKDDEGPEESESESLPFDLI